MSQMFRDNPSVPGQRIWQPSRLPAIGSMVCAIFLGLVTLVVIGLGIMAMSAKGPLHLRLAVAGMMIALVLFLGLMTQYVWRDAKGKWGGRITLDAASLRLDLPAGRSLIHKPAACHRTLSMADISSIETRVEGYGAQGMAMLQRPYRLLCRDGSSIFLFEQRALATRMADTPLRMVAQEIATAAAVSVVELPIAQGRGGVLGVWFTQAPTWDASRLTPVAEKRLMGRVRLTSILVGSAGILVIAAYLFS